MGLDKCKYISLPKITDSRGNLTVVESDVNLPFSIKRVYYLYDVPAGESRAGHAHWELQQLFVAVSGSFDLVLDDGQNRKTFTLNRPFTGLYVCSKIWREVNNFSSGSVCLVFASQYYNESDYCRDYDKFIENMAKK